MGASIFWGSREGRRADYETAELMQSLSKATCIPLSDLEELHHIFLLQHPDGVMTRDEFVRDNVAAHGGCEALWNRVFDFAALSSADEEDPSGTTSDGHRQATHLTFGQVMMATTSGKRRDGTTFEALAKRVFRFLDLDNNSVVDEAELRTVIGWMYALPETVQLRQRADVLVKFCGQVPPLAGYRSNVSSSDGGATLAELRHVYPALVDPADRAAQIMRWMDMDQDGFLCEAEFMEACRGDQSFVEAFSFVP